MRQYEIPSPNTPKDTGLELSDRLERLSSLRLVSGEVGKEDCSEMKQGEGHSVGWGDGESRNDGVGHGKLESRVEESSGG